MRNVAHINLKRFYTSCENLKSFEKKNAKIIRLRNGVNHFETTCMQKNIQDDAQCHCLTLIHFALTGEDDSDLNVCFAEIRLDIRGKSWSLCTPTRRQGKGKPSLACLLYSSFFLNHFFIILVVFVALRRSV